MATNVNGRNCTWCELSQEHRDAFERARQLWHTASPPQPSVGNMSKPSRHSATRLALAASVLMAVAVGMLANHRDWGADYRTTTAERKRVELDDGSTVLLDADTAVDIEYSADFRNVRLRRGRALFDVAPNVIGKMEPTEALQKILEGSGLTYQFTSRSAVILQRLPDQKGLAS